MTITKALLEPEKGDDLECMFNPDTLKLSRTNSWKAEPQPGRGPTDAQFLGGANMTLTVGPLVFDTTDTGEPVTKYTDRVLKLMEVDPSLPGPGGNANAARPPWVRLHWGDLHSFKSVITSATVDFVMFSNTGVPLRATVQLGLLQYAEEPKWSPQNPTSGTPRPHRVHRVQPGETLDRISAQHYGTATEWRRIAVANGVEDPTSLRPGAYLSIPQRTD